MLKNAMFLSVLLMHSVSAFAQTSDEMTCSEAIAHYERSREINVKQDGQVLPINQGTPIRQADMLNCAGNGSRFDTMVPTRDDPQCVIAAYCG
ncbi:MAG TPA: hypothetical protein VLQ68_09310 [Rhizobiaceae bacterium]|nr:hypothetical protein [Rhizobiaceae bacterium]